jgi:hypothetical protein
VRKSRRCYFPTASPSEPPCRQPTRRYDLLQQQARFFLNLDVGNDFAFESELDRVADQVDEHLPQADQIPNEILRNLGSNQG